MRPHRAALIAMLLAASIACSDSLNNHRDGGAGGAGEGGTAGINTGQAGTGGVGGTTGSGGADGGGAGGAAPAGTTGQIGGTGGIAGVGGGAAGTNSGQGGTAGDGGFAGVGGTTVLGGKGGNWMPPPRCLVDLKASCPLSGECSRQTVSDNATKWCFGGGETVSVVNPPGFCTGVGATVTEVRRSDGTLCYSLEEVCLRESSQYVWRDGSGAVVARGAVSRYGSSVTCETTGEACSESTGFMMVARDSCLTPNALAATSGHSCTEGSCR